MPVKAIFNKIQRYLEDLDSAELGELAAMILNTGEFDLEMAHEFFDSLGPDRNEFANNFHDAVTSEDE